MTAFDPIDDVPMRSDTRGGRQEFLIDVDRPVDSKGQLRPALGEIIEDLASRALLAERLATQAGRWCPDLLLPDRSECEVKGIGPGSSGVFFHESQVHALGHRRDYRIAFVVYHAQIATPTTIRRARRTVAESLPSIVIVPASTVRRSVSRVNWRQLGDGRRGKGISRAHVQRWWRRAKQRWRVPAPHVDRTAFVEIRATDCRFGDQWWTDEIRSMAAFMLIDLHRSRHEVSLMPAPRPSHHGHMVRVVADSTLPRWYRDILASRPLPCRVHRNHPTSTYKRSDVLRWLQTIADDRRLHPAAEDVILPAILHEIDSDDWMEQAV
mgnify:CR=1 FL=1